MGRKHGSSKKKKKKKKKTKKKKKNNGENVVKKNHPKKKKKQKKKKKKTKKKRARNGLGEGCPNPTRRGGRRQGGNGDMLSRAVESLGGKKGLSAENLG